MIKNIIGFGLIGFAFWQLAKSKEQPNGGDNGNGNNTLDDPMVETAESEEVDSSRKVRVNMAV